MSDSPFLITSERRAREATRRKSEGKEAWAANSRTLGRSAGSDGDKKKALERPPGAGLTRRERRVKKILLKELKKLSIGFGLTYNEKQKLEKTLDVDFIDAELVKMRKQLKWSPTLQAVAGILIFLSLAFTYFGDPIAISAVSAIAILVAFIAFGVWGTWTNYSSIRRKIFIYEALRELSDAEDEGVQLNDTVALADLLIDRIVDAEEEAAVTPLRRIRA